MIVDTTKQYERQDGTFVTYDGYYALCFKCKNQPEVSVIAYSV